MSVAFYTMARGLHIEPAGATTCTRKGEKKMLHWSLVFLVIAIIAAILGFDQSRDRKTL